MKWALDLPLLDRLLPAATQRSNIFFLTTGYEKLFANDWIGGTMSAGDVRNWKHYKEILLFADQAQLKDEMAKRRARTISSVAPLFVQSHGCGTRLTPMTNTFTTTTNEIVAPQPENYLQERPSWSWMVTITNRLNIFSHAVNVWKKEKERTRKERAMAFACLTSNPNGCGG